MQNLTEQQNFILGSIAVNSLNEDLLNYEVASLENGNLEVNIIGTHGSTCKVLLGLDVESGGVFGRYLGLADLEFINKQIADTEAQILIAKEFNNQFQINRLTSRRIVLQTTVIQNYE